VRHFLLMFGLAGSAGCLAVGPPVSMEAVASRAVGGVVIRGGVLAVWRRVNTAPTTSLEARPPGATWNDEGSPEMRQLPEPSKGEGAATLQRPTEDLENGGAASVPRSPLPGSGCGNAR
jgi:hypothetical protein